MIISDAIFGRDIHRLHPDAALDSRGLFANGVTGDLNGIIPVPDQNGGEVFPLSQFDFEERSLTHPLRINPLLREFWTKQALHMSDEEVGLTQAVLGQIAFSPRPECAEESVIERIRTTGWDCYGHMRAKRVFIDAVIDWHLANRHF